MSHHDSTSGPGGDATGTEQGATTTGRPSLSEPRRSVRWAVESGAAAGVGASASVLAGLRALRRGDRGSAFVRLFVGGLLATVAVAQRRSAGERGGARPGVDEPEPVTGAASEVAGTNVDIEEAAEESGADEDVATRTADETAERDPQAETSDVGPDEGAAGSESTLDAETTPDEERLAAEDPSAGETAAEEDLADEDARDAGEASEEYERLGEAAFDGQSGRVPAPQEAFNQGLLSTGAEAFWGIREGDDYVIVSGVFDPLDDAEGVRYVASSEVDDDDRDVRIPDTVLNHWDDVAGGGDAVVSGTDIVFIISEELRMDDQLLVVPEQWADEMFEESEE